MTRQRFSLAAIFGAPLVLAALSLIGLVGALLEDGVWDGVGAALLATSLVAVVWARLRRRDRSPISDAARSAHEAGRPLQPVVDRLPEPVRRDR